MLSASISLMYLDDIKFYAGTDDHLRNLLQIVFNHEIWIKFGLDTCRIEE